MIFFSTASAAWYTNHPDFNGPRRLRASDYLLAHTQPTDAVWQDSMPRLLLETNLQPGSRYPLTFLFINYDTAPLEYVRGILADFRQRKPKYILLKADYEGWMNFQADNYSPLTLRPVRRANYLAAWRQIHAYVLTHYVPEITLDSETLFRRR